MPGGSTCWNGARSRRYAASFDIDWDTLPVHAARRRAAADPRAALRRGAGERRDRAALRRRRGQLLGLVFRAPAADRAQPLRRDPAQGRRARPAPSDEPAGRRLLELAARYRGPRNPPREQGAATSSASSRRSPAAPTIIERGLAAYRPKSGEPGARARAASPAGAAALPAGALAARRQRDQLPALLRHQHAGRAARRGSATPSTPCIGWSRG